MWENTSINVGTSKIGTEKNITFKYLGNGVVDTYKTLVKVVQNIRTSCSCYNAYYDNKTKQLHIKFKCKNLNNRQKKMNQKSYTTSKNTYITMIENGKKVEYRLSFSCKCTL